jgi:uncharacterized transporter YbjL
LPQPRRCRARDDSPPARFALEQTGNDLPNISYTTAYPVATVGKILIGQLILPIMLGG